jgi:hypothetical protein
LLKFGVKITDLSGEDVPPVDTMVSGQRQLLTSHPKKLFLFEAGWHLLLTATQSALFGFLKYAGNSLKYTNLLKVHYFGLVCGILEFFKYSTPEP